MKRRSGFLVGLGSAVALLGIIASLEVEVAVARGAATPAPINRALKGDRLAAITGLPNAPVQASYARAAEPKLPAECHATFTTRNTFAAEVAGRCVS